MFWDLNGATRIPRCFKIRHSAVATMLFPTCDAVPTIMRLLVMFVSFAPRSGARKLARGTRFLRTPGNRRYTALRLRSSVPPLHVQTNHCGSRQCRITQNLFVPAIENVFDPQHQIDERAERIASAQIDFLVSRISHD